MPQLTFNYGKILTLCIRTRNNALPLKQQLQRLALLDPGVHERMEIIVVDNDSTDGTSSMVKQFEGRVPFRYISNTDNLGHDNSFTFALNQAIPVRSKYIWLLDARNVVRIEFFDEMLQVLEKNEFGLVYLSLNARARKPLVQYVDADDFLQVVQMGIVDMNRHLVRTDFIRGYNPRKFGAGSGIPAVPLLLHVALSGKQNAVYGPRLLNELCTDPIREVRDPVRTYVKNLLNVFDRYEDDSSATSLSPATVMKMKTSVSDCLLPLIVRLFVLRSGGKGLDTKVCRQTVRQYLGWRPVVSVLKRCVSGKVWGRVVLFVLAVLRRIIAAVLAILTILVCNTVVTRAWRQFCNSLVSYRFRYRVRSAKRCSVEAPVTVEGKNIQIGTGFRSGPGLCLQSVSTGNYTPRITVGDNVAVGCNVCISSIRDVRIGNNVQIGRDVLITDHQCGKTDFESLQILPQDRQLVTRGPVTVGDNVIIGPKAVILSGVKVGKGAVVAAGAVVTHDVPPYGIAMGVPAVIRKSQVPETNC